jgi:ACR3 family arsenite efflux pump ArsB
VLVGWSAPDFAQRLRILINLTLFLMLYPMMVGIRVEEIFKAAKNVRPISWSLLFNFVLSPLVGYLLVLLVLRNHPDFAVALLLLATTPCAGMVVGWTGFAKGNVALALVIVALSLTLSIFTIPVTMSLLAHSLVAINALALAAQFFSPLTVVMLAINPLIQMPAMALFLRWSPRLAGAPKEGPAY